MGMDLLGGLRAGHGARGELVPDLSLLDDAASYRGPERRGSKGAVMARLMVGALDELDYGMILLGEGGVVLHANHAARRALDDTHPLQVHDRRLRGRTASDHEQLTEALHGAKDRGTRTLVDLGAADRRVRLSVTPLSPGQGGSMGSKALLVTLQRNRIVEQLSVAAYARAHGLSPREEDVLAALCAGLSPSDIADRLDLSRATVRSHIHNIKGKTHAGSMVALMHQIAMLPPIVMALRE